MLSKRQIAVFSLLLITSLAIIPEFAKATETYTFVSALNGYVPETPGNDPTYYFLLPGQVAVDSSGNLFVIGYDQNSHLQIYKFNSAYEPVPFTFSTTSGTTINFDQPSDITFDNAGNIYVVDRLNVRKFSPTGTLITTIGTWTDDVFSLPMVTFGTRPIGLTVEQSNVYVIVSGPIDGFPIGYSIYKFSPSGNGPSYTLSTSWGGIGGETGSFMGPSGIAVSNGYVYVGDSQNQRIQKFTDSGTFIQQWLMNASATLPNYNPGDVVADSSGNILVSLPFANCVLKFSDTGTLLETIGVPGSGSSAEGEFNLPLGMDIDGYGFLYIADGYNSRIQKFSPPTPPPPPPTTNQFVFNSIPTPRIVGQAFEISITAEDASRNHLTSYSGTITLTCSNQATIWPYRITITNGYWEGYVEIDSPGNHITLTATADDGTTGESINFNVIPSSVVPEYPLGALLALIACFAAIGVYKKINHFSNRKGIL